MRSTPHSTLETWAPEVARPWTREALADLRTAAGAFRLGLTGAFSAWPALVGRVAFYAVCLMVLGAFWGKVGASRLPGTLATRLPPGGLGPYVGVTEWIVISVVTVQLRFEDEVRSGALEARLLRPRSWALLLIAEAAGGTAARMIAIAPAALALLATTGLWPGAQALARTALLAVGGAGLTLLVYALVGLSAFWVRRVLPAMLIAQKLMFLLGGLFAPISLYGGWLHTLAFASPFAAQLGFPGQSILAMSWGGFARALAAQAAWTIILAVIVAHAARTGVAKTLRDGA
jgi:ABC-2 type transport system permease protein